MSRHNSHQTHRELVQSGDLDPEQVRDLLCQPYTSLPHPEPDWWFERYNLHYPARSVLRLVAALGESQAVLHPALPEMEPFVRCMVELGLAAGGVIRADEISDVSRSSLFSFLLTMSFSEDLIAVGETVWGADFRVILAEHTPTLPWIRLSDLERFTGVFSQLSPEAAADLLCRGEWRSFVEAMDLLEAHPGPLRPALLRCAERWLEKYGDDQVSYGGYGNLVNLLGLARTGTVEPRFYRLMDVCTHGARDRDLLTEAINVLPLQERERRATKWSNGIDMLYAPHAPTPLVIQRLIEEVSGWKRSERGWKVDRTPGAFAAWGAAAVPHLIAALDGSRAPFTPMLLRALAAQEHPEAAAVFDRYLDHKNTREAAAAGLAALGKEIAGPIIEASLFARKKDRRIGAALALKALPAPDLQRSLATRRLEKERAADVKALLSEILDAR